MTITIELDDRNALDALNALTHRLDDLTPAMQRIGEHLMTSTKARFATSTGPHGTPWQRNTETTYLRALGRTPKSTLTKGKDRGRINAKGVRAMSGKKPLIGETKRLSSETHYMAGRDSVSVGSSLVYAAVQQFGAVKFQLGVMPRSGLPIPWGNIPPRPFLGVNAKDAESVATIVQTYLASALR